MAWQKRVVHCSARPFCVQPGSRKASLAPACVQKFAAFAPHRTTVPLVPLANGRSECDILKIMRSASHPLPDLSVATRCAGDDDSRRPGDGDLIGIATKTRAKPKKPSQFKVLMLNDDYTPMEFVVMVLKRFFHMDLEQATRVMLHVHQRGVGVCGIFPYEIAETKVNQVMDFARQNQHPLQCTLEKA